MKISTNRFSKSGFNKGSGSFSTFINKSSHQFSSTTFKKGIHSFASNVNRSNNRFVKTIFNMSQSMWFGANTSESAYGVDDMFGGPDSTYGTTPYTGTAHFKLRDDYSITH